MENTLQKILETLGGPDGIWWLAGAYFGMVILERLFYLVKRSQSYDDADALCSIGLNLMNSVLRLLVSFLLPIVFYIWIYENFRFFEADSILLAMGAAFLVHELAYYCEHRLSHRVGIFWAFHSIHHSSNSFNHTTAARGFFFDGMLKVPFEMVGAMFGIPPVIYFAVVAVKNIFGIWNHASYIGDLGIFEGILATPRNHMVHHANQPQYIDTNYSQVLIVWDRMFGTFARYQEPPIVGLVDQVYDNNPLTAQFAGLQQLRRKVATAERWQDKLAYLWRPPEWSHDGRCHGSCPKYRPTIIAAE